MKKTANVLTREEVQSMNQALFEDFKSPDPATQKRAATTVGDYVRLKLREDGALRQVMPPETISNEELDIQLYTDQPVRIEEMEIDSPAAISVAFNTQPEGEYIRGRRFAVQFSRIVSPAFVKDVDELRTHRMDTRQILSDNAIRDMMVEEDSNMISAIESLLIAKDATVPCSGVVQWQGIGGAVSRDSLWDSIKVLPSTPFHFETHTVLVNNITIKELGKFDFREMGGDLSGKIMKDGFSEEDFMGFRWIVSNKRDLIPDNRMYQFGPPNALGKHYMLEDVVMFSETKAWTLTYYMYQLTGATFAHAGALGIVDFE